VKGNQPIGNHLTAWPTARAGHREIDGSEARARLIVHWPQIDDIENCC